jgi:hypothetical protein
MLPNRSYISPTRGFRKQEPRSTLGGTMCAPREDALFPPVPAYSLPTAPVNRAGPPMEFFSPRSTLTPASPRSVGVDSPAVHRCPSSPPSRAGLAMQQHSVVPSQNPGCGAVFAPAAADSTQVVITTTTSFDTEVPTVYGGIAETPTVYGGIGEFPQSSLCAPALCAPVTTTSFSTDGGEPVVTARGSQVQGAPSHMPILR